MATINEIIARTDAMEENTFTAMQKAEWLLALEGQIFETVIKTHEVKPEDAEYRAKRFPRDGDAPLLISAPWDGVYLFYLLSRIFFSRKEMQNYANASAAYNTAMAEWKEYFHRTHKPLSRQAKNYL